MENWQDQGIVLSVRPHGEGGAVVALLTEGHGRYSGYVHGAQSSKKRAMLEPGSCVSAVWQSRTSDALGHFTLEPERGLPGGVLDDPLKLGALLSACALCDAALPDREGHPGLFHGLSALIGAFDSDHWGAVYVMWEIALLKELGFGLDLVRCAAGGDASTLSHISPKSGCAVSAAAAKPYMDKLLALPSFLKPSPRPSPFREREGPAQREGEGNLEEEIIKGLRMTAYFLEHWVFTHHTKGVPEARIRFQERFERKFTAQPACAAV